MEAEQMRALKFVALGALLAGLALPDAFSQSAPSAPEAPPAFDAQMNLLSNGLVGQPQFDADRSAFEEEEPLAKGLGPVYNAASCRNCHANPITGGISQITELRAGHFDGFNFIEHAGGSLINDRAIDPGYQERVLGGNEVRTFRTSLNILGDGFVEAIDSNTLVAISNSQPFGMQGQFIQVPVLESNNRVRGGRFGWKNQQASLLSFSSDAYLNEQGITNRFNLIDNTSNGRFVDDGVPGNEDVENDIDKFAEFMRATGVPPRDTVLANTADALAGSSLFNSIGCNVCHVRNITTAPLNTVINQGAFTVPAALANKLIHPLSDFLLHDVGTGDGIVQNGGQSTRNKLRTAPLWGMRSRDRLMHDGESLTRNEAILRHAGEANSVIFNYQLLSTTQKNQLITFLNSL
jgi:CxxC motif-containing protein (DUF1111 family)